MLFNLTFRMVFISRFAKDLKSKITNHLNERKKCFKNKDINKINSKKYLFLINCINLKKPN